MIRLKRISAITLAVKDMARSVDFYRRLGLELSYGGDEADFTSFRAGDGALNLILTPDRENGWWGGVILRVEDVDTLYRQLKEQGLEPEAPRDGSWGERFFHIWDPDGHELSFAEELPSKAPRGRAG